ncbi:XapX domain-containing protein [Streptomyces pimonensis]|uniref:XapX domain-containing protein n=1 Tax=Streptomyces pimonensis TaxID=2860288 RepID=A0ABV4J861_9ACTN
MSAAGATRGFLRKACLSFAAGLLMGALYWAMDLTSPAPPLLGLTGLAGIVLGERAATAVRHRLIRRRPAPPSATEEGTPRVP